MSSSFETKADISQLKKEIEHCLSTLESIQLRISKYKNSLSGKPGSGNFIRDGFWKLRWQNHKEQVTAYKEKISGHYTRIQVQMQILGMDAAASDTQKVNERFDRTDSMLFQIAEAVVQRQKPTKDDQLAGRGANRGVFVSGYVRPAVQKVRAIEAKTPTGVIRAVPIGSLFEKAAIACRQCCQELALRCSKDNTFYRDTDFDIDLDLIEGNRNCLDDLLLDIRESSGLDPKAVQRVRHIFPNPSFLKDGVVRDVGVINAIALRWWQAGIATALNVPSLLKRLCVFQDQAAGIYGFLFHRDGTWVSSIVDDNLYLAKADWYELSDDERATIVESFFSVPGKEDSETYREQFQIHSRGLYFNACMDENETWLPLFEKAYAKVHGDYAALNWGNPGYVRTFL